jgi:serine/threonine protein phosphatase PrpC
MWTTAGHSDSYRGDASEDRWAVIERPNGGLLLVVADGVGGRPNGGAAAEIAVRLVHDLHAEVKAGDADGWAELVTHIDGELAGNDAVGETTLVLVEATQRRLAGASAGDSEAWRLLATLDAPAEVLTAEQRAKPFVGSGMARAVGFRSGPLAPGETLLVATDGLFKYADAECIREATREPDIDTAARVVGEMARGSTSRRLYDDLALILCRAKHPAAVEATERTRGLWAWASWPWRTR